jgi:hypothetical protein
MAKQRSPNCPHITFLEAASKARSVYAKEHTHPAEKETIAEDLGYTSISGASLSAIGSLRQYGFLEPSGDGLRISDTAVDYFELPDGDPQKKHAAMKMAFRPTLFNQLLKQFEGNPPSDANLRHTLIRQGFLPKAAEEVLGVYKENFKLVDSGEVGYNVSEEEQVTATQEPVRSPASRGTTTAETPLAPPIGANISTPVGKDDEGRAVFASVRFDAPLRKEFVTGLKKYLDYLETTLQ